MSIHGRAGAAAKSLALWACLGVVVLAIILTALGFLVIGLFVWIEQYQSPAAAAGITGAILLGLAILIGLIGSLVLRKMKKKQPSLVAEFTGIAGIAGPFAGFLIRRDPRKSLILAVIAGAVAEYITSGDKKK